MLMEKDMMNNNGAMFNQSAVASNGGTASVTINNINATPQRPSPQALAEKLQQVCHAAPYVLRPS